ncbi:Uncharacterised protein [Mycobacteroides abscessus subsp. massiliense]|nr:Uncharacterised protein [Mycobacteroides abscessus subsp. massiliense]
MLDGEEIPVLRDIGEVMQESVAVGVGELQCAAEQHREDEEYGQFALSEQGECGEPEPVGDRGASRAT